MPVPVPIAGTSSHPCGVGISAILLGPFISILVSSIALLFQALFLAHGGLTTWGANIVSMGIVGSCSAYFSFVILRKFKFPLFVSGFVAGLLADWTTYTTTSLQLALSLNTQDKFIPLFITIMIAFIPTQLPLGILEGVLTGGMVIFVANRRADILISLGIIKDKTRKAITIILISIIVASTAFANNDKTWVGVDETVIEKFAEECGRTAQQPLINTDQGDLLLFAFLLAGIIGGFIAGINYQKLFGRRENDKLK
jgi:cobalt/nickel transport system permease protein